MAQVVRAAGELGVLRTVIAADGTPAGPCEHRIEIPRVDEWLSPFLQIVPVQFLSYFVALERGTHPDTGHEDDPAHARAKQHFKL
jgi:glucosamine 6-phosphate synthetase-like amidotransferase/phosphosugar isomerase protein